MTTFVAFNGMIFLVVVGLYFALRKIVLLPLAAVEPAGRSGVGRIVVLVAAPVWLGGWAALAALFASTTTAYAISNNANRWLYGICTFVWWSVLMARLGKSGERELEKASEKGAYSHRDHMAYLVWFRLFGNITMVVGLLSLLVFSVWPNFIAVLAD